MWACSSPTSIKRWMSRATSAAPFKSAFESGFDRAPSPLVWLRNQWHEFRFGNRTIEQAKINARFHYAIPAEFYAYWLDEPLMMYTCAYWKPGTRTVEEAQRNKIDHVCRKLRLQPGESVVDIGCGFGGFMLHAWENYGVQSVRRQHHHRASGWLRGRIRSARLADQLEVREADFRDVACAIRQGGLDRRARARRPRSA